MSEPPPSAHAVNPNNPEQGVREAPSAYDEVADALRRMRMSAGQVSYGEIVARIARQRRDRDGESATRPARTTVYDAFRRGRTRVSPVLVGEIVHALTGDESQSREWERRCVEAVRAAERPESPRARTEPPVAVALVHDVGSTLSGGGAGRSGPDAEADRSASTAAVPGGAERLRPGVAFLLVVAALLTNLVGIALSTALQLPIFVDMIGTAVVAMVLGPWAGAAVGVASNLAGAAVDGPASILFGLVQVAGAVVWGIGARRWGMASSPSRFLVLNVAVAIVCSLVATPMLALVLEGDLASEQHPLGARLLELSGAYLPSVLGGNLFYSLVDKVLAGSLALTVISGVPVLREVAWELLGLPAPRRPDSARAIGST